MNKLDEPQERTNITISKRLKKKAKKIGVDNISRGIRLALEKYKHR